MGSKLPPATTASHISANQNKAHLPVDLQQQLLNIFKYAFPLSQTSTLKSTIQKVKGHLYNRDFDAAFGQPDYLEAYALRWSPGRALAYCKLFSHSAPLSALWHERALSTADPKILCIGGGAGAEAVALAGLIRLGVLKGASVVVVDRADWSEVLEKLRQTIVTFDVRLLTVPEAARAPTPSPTTDPALSLDDSTPILTHTSPIPTPTVSSSPIVESADFHLAFKYEDVLSVDETSLRSLLTDCTLVTILFTLNELFASSLGTTTKFLLTLTDSAQPNSMLLVVDSSGSYSEVSLKKDQHPKRYPMEWLLDHVLLEASKPSRKETGKWEKVTSEGSKWFRVDRSLDYPMPLENMRYQMHLYRRL